MVQIPPMNLSPEATPWGREMQRRVEEAERSVARLQQETTNSLRAINGTMTNLGVQTHVVTGNFGLAANLSAPTITSAIGQDIVFTITERRVVVATCTTNYVYNKNSGGLSTGFGALGVHFNSLWQYGNVSYGSNSATSWQGGSLTAVNSLVLEPGTYTAGCTAELQVGDAVSSPSGQVRMNDTYIFQVNVYGRA